MMNYFTPKRWLRLQDTSDEPAWLAAHQEWEQALAAYWARVRELAARLPPEGPFEGIRQYLQLGSLHDATITSCWYEGSDTLKIQVQPSLPGERLVLLEYLLTQDPFVLPNCLPPEYRSTTLEWMYDELTVLPQSVANGTMIFNHALFLSNGWEMDITFSRLKVMRFHSIWPVSRQPPLGFPEATQPREESRIAAGDPPSPVLS